MGGVERVFIEDALSMIREKVFAGGGMPDFNHDRLDAKEASASKIRTCVDTLPMMAPMRLVEVRNADDLKADALKDLKPMLENPPAETVVVFIFRKFDQRQTLVKTIVKNATACKFDHPRESEMPGIVARRAKARGVRLNPEAAEALALTVGADLGFLERALEKLELVLDDREGTLDDISTHVANTHLEDAFRFAAQVAVSNRVAALGALHRLEINRATPLALLGVLAWQLRQLVRARTMLDEGRSPRDIGKELRAYGDRANTLLGGARRFPLPIHTRRLGRLAFVDQKLKSTPVSGFRLLERLVLELCPA